MKHDTLEVAVLVTIHLLTFSAFLAVTDIAPWSTVFLAAAQALGAIFALWLRSL